MFKKCLFPVCLILISSCATPEKKPVNPEKTDSVKRFEENLMSRRKCCCPCDESINCLPIRDVGKVRCDPIKVVIPDEFQDQYGCTTTPALCETTLPDTYIIPDADLAPGCTGVDRWFVNTFSLPDCRGDNSAFRSILVTQECVDDVCIVTVLVSLSTTGLSEWTYKAVGPINISNGKEFIVPFFSENQTGSPPCASGVFAEELIIKEV